MLSTLITRSLVESSIYDINIYDCIYLYSLFPHYCEVDVKSVGSYKYNLDTWESELKTSYSNQELSLQTKYPLSGTLNFRLDYKNCVPIRIITLKEILRECIYLRKTNRVLEDCKKYWFKNDYGFWTSHSLSSIGIRVAFVPTLSVIELLKVKNEYKTMQKSILKETNL